MKNYPGIQLTATLSLCLQKGCSVWHHRGRSSSSEFSPKLYKEGDIGVGTGRTNGNLEAQEEEKVPGRGQGKQFRRCVSQPLLSSGKQMLNLSQQCKRLIRKQCLWKNKRDGGSTFGWESLRPHCRSDALWPPTGGAGTRLFVTGVLHLAEKSRNIHTLQGKA